MAKPSRPTAPAAAPELPLAPPPPPDPSIPVTRQYLGFTDTTWTTRASDSSSVWSHRIRRLEPDAEGFEIEHEMTQRISGGRYESHRVTVYRAGELIGEWRPTEHEFTGHGCSPRLLASTLIHRINGE